MHFHYQTHVCWCYHIFTYYILRVFEEKIPLPIFSGENKKYYNYICILLLDTVNRSCNGTETAFKKLFGKKFEDINFDFLFKEVDKGDDGETKKHSCVIQ